MPSPTPPTSPCLPARVTFLPHMEDDVVAPDLMLFSNLIHVVLRAGDALKAPASPVCASRGSGLKAYNAAVATHCKSDLLRGTKRPLLHDMPADGIAPKCPT
ncbi:hypothetical protein ACP4OV_003146 [Aristida adscensionis]